jgi:hypothetical protein
MPKTDRYEDEILAAFDKGAMKSVATKAWRGHSGFAPRSFSST